MNAALSRLLAAMTYPRAVDDFVELALPLFSTRSVTGAATPNVTVRARVIDVRRETHDVSTLVLTPNALWSGHRAGQYVALTAEVRGVRMTRCFSIASSEGGDSSRLIALTVKARPDGAVTPVLVSGQLRGAIVELSQATGDFVLPEVLPEREAASHRSCRCCARSSREAAGTSVT
jgi:stearoyl-CoA 9-desaturase NADPH oxidoreductase